MEKSLSDAEIAQFIPTVIPYDKLEDVDENKLLRNLPVAILYMNAPNHGHWTLLHKTPEGLEFFDPYGIKPDLEFKMISDQYQQPRYLARLLSKISEKIPINYSQYQFQEFGPGINTCGRWIILRDMYGNLGIDAFKKSIEKVLSDLHISGDDLVTKITSP